MENLNIIIATDRILDINEEYVHRPRYKPCRLKKPVYEFTLDGEFIAKYNSVAEAASKIPLEVCSISNICSGRNLKSIKTNRIYLYDKKEIKKRLKQIKTQKNYVQSKFRNGLP